jgi:hypothetical protein
MDMQAGDMYHALCFFRLKRVLEGPILRRCRTTVLL